MQWDVLDRAFVGHATMVLIGDPKQAIYAFRGGDIVTYLTRRRGRATHADPRHQLAQRPSRSSSASRRCSRGAALGDDRIVVRDVARPPHGPPAGRRPAQRPVPAAAWSRARSSGVPAHKTVADRPASATTCSADLAADVKAAAGQRRDVRRAARSRPVTSPSSSRPTSDARVCRDALAAAGVPAVYTGDTDVFASRAAADWLCLLEAFEQPHRSGAGPGGGHHDVLRGVRGEPRRGRRRAHRPGRRRRCASGPTTPASAGWRPCSRRRRSPGWPAGCSRWRGGERHLTDLRPRRRRCSTRPPTGSGSACRRCSTGCATSSPSARGAGRAQPAPRQRRRGGPDHDRVGEQGPAVPPRLPAVRVQPPRPRPGTTCSTTDDGRPLPRHRRQRPRRLHQAIAGPRPAGVGRRRHPAHLRRADPGPVAGRGLVGAVVGRAQRRPAPGCCAAAAPATPRCPTGAGPALRRRRDPRLRALAARRAARRRELRDRGRAASAPPAEPPPGPRRTARSPGPIDTAWRRTSYSGLTAFRRATRSRGVASEPEVGAARRRAFETPAVARRARDAPGADLPSPMARPARSARPSARWSTGCSSTPTRCAPDLDGAELARHVAEQLAWWPVDADAEELAAALVPLHHTPLGSAAARADAGAGSALPDRLRELDFEIPLAGGDLGAVARRPAARPGRRAAPPPRRRRPRAAVRRPAARRRPRRPVAARLPLRLHRRRAAGAGGPRYLVVDYKTNWLGEGPTARSPRADYAPDRRARGDAALRLPPAGDALLRRPPPLPPLAPARLRPRAPPRRRPLPLPAGDVRPRDAGGRRAPCGCLRWRPPAALVDRRSPTCSTAEEVRGDRAVRATRATSGSPVGADRAAPRPSTAPACSTPPTSTWPQRRDRARPRRATSTSRSPCAVACARVRGGSVCVDLDDRSPTAAEAVAWPDPAAWRAALAASPLPSSRAVLRLDEDLALPRPLLARGGAGLRRPARAGAAAGARGRRGGPRGGPRPGLPARPATTSSATRPPLALRASGPPCSPAAPAPARPRRSPGCSRCWPSRPSATAGRLPDRPGRPHRQGGRAAAAGGRERGRGGFRDEPTATGSPGCEAMTLHRLLGSRPDTSDPVPPPPRQPAPHDVVVVDESSMVVADDDGPAARGAAARHPAGAGRRSRPARLGGGRCGARRPGRRPRRRAPTSPSPRSPPPTGSARPSARWPRRARRATPTPWSSAAAGGDHVVFDETDEPEPVLREVLLPRARELRLAGRGGDVDGGAGAARPPPAALRPPRRSLRRPPLEPARSSAWLSRGPPRPTTGRAGTPAGRSW